MMPTADDAEFINKLRSLHHRRSGPGRDVTSMVKTTEQRWSERGYGVTKETWDDRVSAEVHPEPVTREA